MVVVSLSHTTEGVGFHRDEVVSKSLEIPIDRDLFTGTLYCCDEIGD